MPKRLHFASLGHCNENCLFCVKGGHNPGERLIPTSRAKRLLRDKFAEGCSAVTFDGGEPTLRSDLPELARYAFECGYASVDIITNGVRLADPRLVDRLAAAPVRAGQELEVCVSLHSHSARVSERLTRSRGTFRRTIRGIRNLLDRGLAVGLYHVITRLNYRALPGFVRYVRARLPGVRAVTFSYIYPMGLALENMDIFPRLSLVEPFFRKALALCARHRIRTGLSACGTVPLCLSAGHEELMVERFVKDHPDRVRVLDREHEEPFILATLGFHEQTKVKGAVCVRCALEPICGGLWRAYADIHGMKELRPYRRSQKTDRLLRKYLPSAR